MMGEELLKWRKEGEYCFLGGLLPPFSLAHTHAVSPSVRSGGEISRVGPFFTLSLFPFRPFSASFSIWRAPSAADIFPLFSLRPPLPHLQTLSLLLRFPNSTLYVVFASALHLSIS